MLKGKNFQYLLAVMAVFGLGASGLTGALLVTGTIGGFLMWLTFFGELGIGIWAVMIRIRQLRAAN